MARFSLPSAESAEDFLAGKPGSAWRLSLHLAARSAVIWAGLNLVQMTPRQRVMGAIAGAAAIECAVLAMAGVAKAKGTAENG